MEIKHRFIETNGIRMHLAEAGQGPLVVLCHGWPESWYSWRHQLVALAQAGHHAVAPDMRGYGQTGQPEAIDQYTLLHLVGDMVGLLDALGESTAVIAGHDWGAPVAWHAALLRPDRFRAVIGLSVPFRPRGAVRPTTVMYSPRGMRSPNGGSVGMVRRSGGFLTEREIPASLPPWLAETDIDFYAGEFKRTGFRGGLNWYRNIDRNWEQLAAWAGAKVTVPALYMAGDRDLVVAFPGMEKLLPALKQFIPRLQNTIMLPGCGHWTQQERPAEVNAAMIAFLKALH